MRSTLVSPRFPPEKLDSPSIDDLIDVFDQNGEIQSIVVHSAEYFQYVEGHFNKYISRLREASQSALRHQFLAACRLKWDLGGTPRVIAL